MYTGYMSHSGSMGFVSSSDFRNYRHDQRDTKPQAEIKHVLQMWPSPICFDYGALIGIEIWRMAGLSQRFRGNESTIDRIVQCIPITSAWPSRVAR